MAREGGGSKRRPARAEEAKDGSRVRRAGLRAIAATVPKVTRRALGRRGFAEGGLASDWTAIVGAELAERCIPERLAHARRAGGEGGTLTLRVEPGFATELQHLAPLLMDRINGHLGYRAVGRLKLRHAGPRARPAAQPAPARPLSEDEERELRARVGAVEDESLRGALERLARAVREQEP
jgi:hypothetical protein